MTTREEVEHNYSPSRWSHRFGAKEVIESHVNTVTRASDQARRSVECELAVPYGLSDKEKVDIFGGMTSPGSAPIFVYIHGGYWQDLSREVSAFMAAPLAKAGAVVAVLGYELAPTANMDEIVDQVKRGLRFVMHLANRRGSSGVYLCGSSAGGHLAAMLLANDWMKDAMLRPGLIKGAVLISGVYDLRPLVDTYVNEALGMTVDCAVRNSPATLVDDIAKHSKNRHLVMAYGDHDPPEFQQQSIEMHAELTRLGLTARIIKVPDTDHFNVIERLEEQDYVLTKECVRMMGLSIDNIDEEMKKAKV